MILMTSDIRRAILLASLLSPMGLAFSCSDSKSESAKAEVFPVINPVVRDTLYLREYVADIQSVQNTELRAKADGYLETIHADEGDFVKTGQVLFTISRLQYQQEVLKAEAALASAIAETKAAEVELRNVKALLEKKIVSDSELDLAQARAEALQAKTEEARAHLSSAQLLFSYTQVRAPFSGYINRIPNKVGSLIDEGELLTTLSNNQEMLVYFNVSEREYLDYMAAAKSQQPHEVELVLANGQRYAYRGQVETAESEFDKGTGNIAFRARFPNPEQVLKHGSTGKIRVATPIQQAVLIPQKCVVEIQDKFFVYRVTSEGRVDMQSIVPGYRLPELYVVDGGLAKTDQIIYEGVQLVRAGDQVVAQVVPMKELVNN
ncbi:MAG: efflux RND transporter periplasmic adaptor subunit [Cyclobacteriaceae bacterium]|jgi:membrane fusion protein (multidrug efflux system)|nr:efflux RND transporter periplasmic adaptor subunit [Cyclobacteriaceae bacterium]